MKHHEELLTVLFLVEEVVRDEGGVVLLQPQVPGPVTSRYLPPTKHCWNTIVKPKVRRCEDSTNELRDPDKFWPEDACRNELLLIDI